jgi:hypothetical protein
MNRIQRCFLAGALATLAMVARAAPLGIGQCATADGRPLYVDNAHECKGSSIGTPNQDGSQKEPVTAPLTGEQKTAKEGSGGEPDRCKEQSKRQFQRDFALLDRYRGEDDLQEARYRELGDQIRQIDQANERLKALIATARDFAEKVKFFEPPHRIPDDLKKGRDFNRKLEEIEFQRIAGAAHEIQRINDKYDADLKRYRDLVDGTAKTPCTPGND